MQLLIKEGKKKKSQTTLKFEFVSMNSWKSFAIKTCKFKKNMDKNGYLTCPSFDKVWILGGCICQFLRYLQFPIL